MASNIDGAESRAVVGKEDGSGSGPVVEKSTIETPATTTAAPPTSTDAPVSSTESTATPNTSNTQPATSSEPQSTQPAPAASSETPEQSSGSKIEASSDRPASATDQDAGDAAGAGTSLVITLLLTTGARHPFRIDGRYLRKRGVNVPDHDPFEMSVYTLKELILREWRSEWEPQPSSPSAIRLISFGKLLEDKAPLSESKFNRDAPNVVHMTIKPQELLEEEDAKVTKNSQSRDREGGEGSTSCRCVIL